MSGSIWKASKGDSTTIVDKQKLEKAEAKAREKAEKKLLNEANKKPAARAINNDSGTVSEIILSDFKPFRYCAKSVLKHCVKRCNELIRILASSFSHVLCK